MRLLKIFYASALMVFRLAIMPFVIVQNFILLRRHRRAYKNQISYGNKRFVSNDSYLAALRANMGENIASSLGRCNSDSASSRIVR